MITSSPMGRRWVKRSIDVVASLVGLALLSPVLGTVALAIRLMMGQPVFFRQPRPGQHGRPFVLLKFRTMTETDSHSGSGQQVPPLGSFLRRASIDELPQLWNILKGEMSLVGPRPLSMEYFPLYTSEEARRHDVLPGLTGWAQVNGRHRLSWDERFQLDVWHVDHWSLWLDIKILGMTVRKVFSGAGEAPPPTADFGVDREPVVARRPLESSGITAHSPDNVSRGT